MSSLYDPEILLGADVRVLVTDCVIDGGQMDVCAAHGHRSLRVEPGGSVAAGFIQVRDGARIVALPDGGFVLGPCPECEGVPLESDAGAQDPDVYEHRGMGICNKGRRHAPPCDFGNGL